MTKPEISQNQLNEWKKDPQTGKPNPKSISEAISIKQAIENGLYTSAMRPNLKKGEPNLDFKVIRNDGSTGWLDVKTPIAPIFNSVSHQARAIAEKINLYNGNTEVLIDLKNLQQIGDKTQFATDLHQKINADKLKKVFIIND